MDVILKRVKEPTTEINIVEFGIVKKVENRESKFRIHLNFPKPSCKSCLLIAWLMARAIIRRVEHEIVERS